MTRLWGILAISGLALTGCSATTPDDAYLSTLRDSTPELEEVADADLINLGQNICDSFEQRGFNDGMTDLINLAADSGISTDGAGQLAGAATGAYCPEFSDNF